MAFSGSAFALSEMLPKAEATLDQQFVANILLDDSELQIAG